MALIAFQFGKSIKNLICVYSNYQLIFHAFLSNFELGYHQTIKYQSSLRQLSLSVKALTIQKWLAWLSSFNTYYIQIHASINNETCSVINSQPGLEFLMLLWTMNIYRDGEHCILCVTEAHSFLLTYRII